MTKSSTPSIRTRTLPVASEHSRILSSSAASWVELPALRTTTLKLTSLDTGIARFDVKYELEKAISVFQGSHILALGELERREKKKRKEEITQSKSKLNRAGETYYRVLLLFHRESALVRLPSLPSPTCLPT